MTCHDYDDAIVDAARGLATGLEPAARAHAAQCAACAARLDRELALSEALRAMWAAVEAPDGTAMEAALLARFDAEQAATARSAVRSSRWFGVAAAVVVIVGLAAAWRTVRIDPERDTAIAAADIETTDFVPWPGAAALPTFESGHLVRTQLPVSVLPYLGIANVDAPANGHVTADVLYGQDGLERAVRLVNVRSMNP
jgi:hypothetical protein